MSLHTLHVPIHRGECLLYFRQKHPHISHRNDKLFRQLVVKVSPLKILFLVLLLCLDLLVDVLEHLELVDFWWFFLYK